MRIFVFVCLCTTDLLFYGDLFFHCHYYCITMCSLRVSNINRGKKSTATSAYLARFDATRDIDAFWKNVKDISLNKNRIDALDSKIRSQRGMENPEPTATVAQRGSEAVYQPRSARGAGGIHQSMNGNSQQRRVGGA